VLTGDIEAPSRTWLHQHLECIRTTRAREKISEWFHDRPQSENLEEGRELIKRAFARMGLVAPASSALRDASRRLGYESEESCLIALGTGDCQIVDLLQEIIPSSSEASDSVSEPSQMSLIDEPVLPDRSSGSSFHIEMLADDRAGLLMDITSFLGVHDIMLLSNSGRVLPGTGDAVITIEVRLESLTELHKLMDALEMIPAVRAAKRITNQPS
jgi:(p)ppGpp synthase/HD superfamily hydrolase